MSATVKASPAILYVDTCALLDIVRLPMRSRAPLREIAGIRAVMSAHQDARVVLQVAEVVPDEFARHESNVALEVQRHLRRVREDSQAVRDCARDLSLGDIDWRVDPKALVDVLAVQANDMLAAAKVLTAIERDKLDAMDRQTRSLRPGRRGKDCIMDCIITATMLRVVREQATRSIFLTSNVHDYSVDEKSAQIHGDLKAAFDELNITFVTTWEWAAREVAGPTA